MDVGGSVWIQAEWCPRGRETLRKALWLQGQTLRKLSRQEARAQALGLPVWECTRALCGARLGRSWALEED